jgi:hypothetical protein
MGAGKVEEYSAVQLIFYSFKDGISGLFILI